MSDRESKQVEHARNSRNWFAVRKNNLNKMLIASRGPAGVYGDGCVDHLWLHSIHEGYPIGMAQYVKGTHSCGICAKWRKQGLLETKIHAINDALIKEELEEGLDGYYDEVA